MTTDVMFVLCAGVYVLVFGIMVGQDIENRWFRRNLSVDDDMSREVQRRLGRMP